MARMFGTDGVRGVANTELTPELAFKLGRAGAYVLTQQKPEIKILVGKDTRISGDMLEAALIAGMCSMGVTALRVGVVPTPAIAFLVRHLQADAGVMISASHNPVEFNGIKFFSQEGYKLPDEVEDRIEEIILTDLDSLPRPTGAGVGRVIDLPAAKEAYIQFAMSTIDVPLQGLTVAMDCANGAAYEVAPEVLRRLGATVYVHHALPDGTNINVRCGSTHPSVVARLVKEHQADVGLAFDGDADRLIAADERGEEVNGDHIMAICGRHLAKQGRLKGNTVVATVMSNMGLDLALRQANIALKKTRVGDRYVLQEMLSGGYNLGGEQSGHVIFLDHNTTGDGLITALQLLSVIKTSGQPLSALAGVMQNLPQVLINVKVPHKEKLKDNIAIERAILDAEEKLAGLGRVLVRPSGTEPLVRVMVEGQDEALISVLAKDLAAVIEKELS